MHLDRDLVARILPFAVFIGFIALDGLLQDAASAIGMDARWWYGVGVVVVAGVLVWFWRSYEELHAVAGVPGAHWLLSIAVGIGVFVLWINLDFSPLAFPGSGGFNPAPLNAPPPRARRRRRARPRRSASPAPPRTASSR